MSRRDVLGDIKDLAVAGFPPQTLFRRLHRLLGEEIGLDAGCWHEADPVTGFLSSTVADGLDPAGFGLALHLELWSDDATTFSRLRRSGRVAETIFRATQGKPERSVRFRELISTFGYTDELRVNFDCQGGRWGSAALMRSDRPFQPKEIRLIERSARLVGEAVRSWSVPEPAEQAAGPAVAVIGPAGQLVNADQRAQELMASLTDDMRRSSGVPGSFIVAAERARQRQGRAKTLVKTPHEQWLVLHTSALSDGQAAVVAMPATPAETMPIALLAHGLSPREQEVTLEVLRGGSTKDIARQLHLTGATVQDHLKSIFTKTGVRSRRELVAKFYVVG